MSAAGDVNEREGPSSVELPRDFSAMLDKVLSNPEILTTVASAISGMSGAENAQTQEPSSEVSAEESAQPTVGSVDVDAMMQKLPQMMALLGPMLSGASAKGGGAAPASDKRTCLLSAIKPYLSPARCEAIDYIIKFSKLSEILKTLN